MRKTEWSVVSKYEQFQVGFVFNHYFGGDNLFIVRSIFDNAIFFDIYVKNKQLITHCRLKSFIEEEINIRHWIKVGEIKEYEKLDNKTKEILYSK